LQISIARYLSQVQFFGLDPVVRAVNLFGHVGKKTALSDVYTCFFYEVRIHTRYRFFV